MVSYHDTYQPRSSELPCHCTTPTCVNSPKERVKRDEHFNNIMACLEYTRMSDVSLLDYAIELILRYFSLAFCTEQPPQDAHVLRLFKVVEMPQKYKAIAKEAAEISGGLEAQLLEEGAMAVLGTPEARAAVAKTNLMNNAHSGMTQVADNSDEAEMLRKLINHILKG